jgi:hypothetical protein
MFLFVAAIITLFALGLEADLLKSDLRRFRK